MQTDTLVIYLTGQLEKAKALLPALAVTDDPEVLHRFRVALRRSRSLLHLYEPEYDAIQEILKTVFKPTNTLRELDVLILSINRSDYPTLYQQLDTYRDAHYKEILTAGYITRSRSVLEQLIDELKNADTLHSDQKLIKKARKFADQTDSAYSNINNGTKPKELHRLRIAYKTIRYSLEFLKESGLDYQKKRLKHARQRQEELGQLQDTHNQLEILHRFCTTCSSDECQHLYKERKRSYKKLVKTVRSNL